MEVFYLTVFYIFALISLGGALFAVFAKKTMNSVLGAVVTFWALSGLYFLLGLHYLAAVQILLYGVAVAVLLSFTVMLTNDEEDSKTWFNLDSKTIISFVLLVTLGLLITPFTQSAFVNKNIYFKFSLELFAQEFFKSAFLPFELVSVLLVVVLIGVAALLYRRVR